MTNFKVLVSAPPILPQVIEYKSLCANAGVDLITPDIFVKESLDEEELIKYLRGMDGILCGDDELNSKVLQESHKHLKVISKWGTGIDSIDTESAKQLGIKVYRVKDVFGPPLSDTVMSYILLYSRKIFEKDFVVRNNDWKKITSYTLAERTIGIVGLGHVGKEVARKASAFGMKVYITDILDVDLEDEQSNYKKVNLEELLSVSDFVTIHCDLNESSHHLFSKREFDLMKDNSVVINTARGSIINEEELICALENKVIYGAALDVFEKEPLPENSKLRAMDNVFFSPHNSNGSVETFRKVDKKAINNIFEGLGLGKQDIFS